MAKLMRYMKGLWIPALIAMLLVFAQSYAELSLPSLMSDIVNKGIVGTSAQDSEAMQALRNDPETMQKLMSDPEIGEMIRTLDIDGLIDKLSEVTSGGGNMSEIYKTGGIMLLVTLASTLAAVAASYLAARVSSGYGKKLRAAVFEKVTNYSANELNRVGIPSLITRSTNDVTQLQQVVQMFMTMVARAPMMMVGGIVMAIAQERSLAWIIYVLIPLIVVIIGVSMIFALPYFKKIQTKLDKLNQVMRESLTGVRVIRAFNKMGIEFKRFDHSNKDLSTTMLTVNRIMAFLMPLMMMIMSMSTVVILWVGSGQLDTGSLQIGNLMAFIQYVMQIMFSVVMVSMMFVFLPRAMVSADRINEILDTENDIHDPVTPALPAGPRASVEFRNATFRYLGAQEPVLHDISFTANAGEITAIIGSTGSGKSTLIDLIPRFYDVENGQVLVDGTDVRKYAQSELREKIGLVAQQAVLFSGTIADNIRMGKQDATDAEVQHAADTAQAAHFIGKLPEGMDSWVSQGGTNLSGGQKQRLCIARALVRQPEIYIFDDSFSALDFITDAKLRAALKEETQEATMIIVAQRVSTIMDADRIVVLDEGRVAGIGTHKELMEGCGIYREIVYSQLSAEEVAV